MTTGTTVTVYSTSVSPVGLGEEKQSRVQLLGTIGVLTLPEKTVINERYTLRRDLAAEVRIESDKYVVVNYQVDEYGIGNSLQEAQQDLLNSLVDYLVSLEKRERRLADKELRNLHLLRNILATR